MGKLSDSLPSVQQVLDIALEPCIGEKKEKVCESLVTPSLSYQMLCKYLLFKLESYIIDKARPT